MPKNTDKDGKPLNQVEHFNYLGSYISWDGKCDKEINRRIAIAKNRFNSISSLLTNKKISIKTRRRFAKSYIWSILLYGCESWNISKQLERKINATEMWIWRRILKVSWTERKTNEDILRTMGTTRQLMTSIRKRQLEFLGHIIREQKLESACLTGKMEGRRQRGRPRQKYIDGILRTVGNGITQAGLIRRARDRKGWRSMVANVRSDTALQ